MSFSGKYQMETHENFESFMEAIGVSELIQESKDFKSISEIEETGDHFKVTVTTGTKILTNSFTIGQETELETLTGEKVNSVVMREGNKLTAFMNGTEYVTELTDADTLVNVRHMAGGSRSDTISGLIYTINEMGSLRQCRECNSTVCCHQYCNYILTTPLVSQNVMLFNHCTHTAHTPQQASAWPGAKIEFGCGDQPALPSHWFLGAYTHVGD
uniref:Fatty acid binding protein 1 n=1 Tax=Hucho hucho TaxID=62062 RepID=A0A4W5KL55_9TELE